MTPRSTTLTLLGCATLLVAGGANSAATPAMTRPPTHHRVSLGGNRFTPARLVIQAGDVVEFVNGSGGPHNVAFWPDSLPPGARGPLAAALPDSIAPLMVPLLFEPGQSLAITFSGVPPGRYPYYCLPHLVGGMVAEIIVSP